MVSTRGKIMGRDEQFRTKPSRSLLLRTEAHICFSLFIVWAIHCTHSIQIRERDEPWERATDVKGQ